MIYEREMCFNLDDPNIVGAGNPAVFHKLRSTIAQGDVPVDAWLYVFLSIPLLSISLFRFVFILHLPHSPLRLDMKLQDPF